MGMWEHLRIPKIANMTSESPDESRKISGNAEESCHVNGRKSSGFEGVMVGLRAGKHRKASENATNHPISLLGMPTKDS